ncbi:hypothetical protein AAMO2058_000729600 [Amorphochlora amoebiformis]|mmetsp:Transcript_33476/g.53832  ORF Transcript_33476/g.53832 Transcript_33476/m.53832 type:complete len:489 (-) Transcript_33476:49-1515(-)
MKQANNVPKGNKPLIIALVSLTMLSYVFLNSSSVETIRDYAQIPLDRSTTIPMMLILLVLFSAATAQQALQRAASDPAVKYAPVRTDSHIGIDSPVELVDEEPGDEEDEIRLQTGSEAIFNIVNMYVGVGLWSLPYSLVVGGWESLLVLLVLLVLCYMSAEVLIRLHNRCSLDSASEVGAYLHISKDAFGWWGSILASVFLTGEFLGTAMVLVLTTWDVINKIGVNYSFGAVLSTFLLAPFIWKDEWSNMAYINAFALFSTVIVVLATYFILLNGIQFKEDKSLPSEVSTKGFVNAVGLQMVALGSGTPAVPSIYQQVRDKSDFSRVMITSFVLIAIFCLAMAVGGVMAYGKFSEVLIIDNLMANQGFGSLVSIMVALASFATTPPFIAMTTEIPLAILDREFSTRGKRVLRYGVYLTTIVGCVVFMESLDLILELTGLLCMSMTAIVLPIMMSLKVFRAETTWVTLIAGIVAIIVSLTSTLTYMMLL